jgi:hypothetical protein
VSVGYAINSSVITPVIDNSLYDNALGYPNSNAPGAYRLKLTANLVVVNTSSVNSQFFSIANYVQGNITTSNTVSELSTLGDIIAKNIYNEAGNFVVAPFFVSVVNQPNTSLQSNTFLNVSVGKGEGYVNGYDVQLLNTVYTPILKSIGEVTVNNSITTITNGGELYVNEYAGQFDPTISAVVELHATPYKAVTNGLFTNITRDANDIVGYAYVKSLNFDATYSGTNGPGSNNAVYQFHSLIFKPSPGYTVNDVNSIVYYNGTTVLGVADVYKINGVTAVNGQPSLGKLLYSTHNKGTSNVTNLQFTYRNKSVLSSISGNTITLTLANGNSFAYGGTLNEQESSTFIVIPNVDYYTSNLSGTVTTTGDTTITGTGTFFANDFVTGDWIDIGGVFNQIVTVQNNTSMVAAKNVATATAVTYTKVLPGSLPVNFNNPTNYFTISNERSITINGSTATFNFDHNYTSSSNTTSSSFTIYYDTVIYNATPSKKIVNAYQVVKIDVANHPNGVNGPWSLGVPDVYNLRNVYVDQTGQYGTTNDLRKYFVLDTGQRENNYHPASISVNSQTPIAISNTTSLVVVFDCFTYTTTTTAQFFTVDSYPIDDANTANVSAIQTALIPQYFSPYLNKSYDLRDTLDFRIVSQNNIPYQSSANVTTNITNAHVNPSSNINFATTQNYIVSLYSNFVYNTSYSLPRQDVVVINQNGTVSTVTGLPSITPVAPPVPSSSMAIAIVSVPPYPALAQNDPLSAVRPDYTCTVQYVQQRRFTMQDISNLDQRLTNIENYVSLNALELQANNTSIINANTGLNRYKNGILVDAFTSLNSSDLNDPTYAASIDFNNDVMRPLAVVNTLQLVSNSVTSNGIYFGSNSIMLNYLSDQGITQAYSTQTRNCAQFDIYNWVGHLQLTPSSDTTPVYNNEGNINTVINDNIASNTSPQVVYGAWNVIGQAVNGNQKVITQQRSVTMTTYQNTTTTTNTNNILQSIQYSPYVRRQFIAFIGTGMKPNTNVYMFVNNNNLSNLVIPLSSSEYNAIAPLLQPNSDNTTINALTPQLYQSIGQQLTTDNNGNVYGLVQIPDTSPQSGWTGYTLNTGTLNFALYDINNMATELYDITTMASTTFLAANITQNYDTHTVTTISSVPVTQQSQQTTSVTSTIPTPPPTSSPNNGGYTIGSGSPPAAPNVVYNQYIYVIDAAGPFRTFQPIGAAPSVIPSGYTVVIKSGSDYFIPTVSSNGIQEYADSFANNSMTQVNLNQVISSSTLPIFVIDLIQTMNLYTNFAGGGS